MGNIQVMMQEIPATLFLNGNTRQILFVKQYPKNFIDFQQGQDMVAWSKDALCIGENEYKYNQWHSPLEHEDLKTYFKAVLHDVF